MARAVQLEVRSSVRPLVSTYSFWPLSNFKSAAGFAAAATCGLFSFTWTIAAAMPGTLGNRQLLHLRRHIIPTRLLLAPFFLIITQCYRLDLTSGLFHVFISTCSLLLIAHG